MKRPVCQLIEEIFYRILNDFLKTGKKNEQILKITIRINIL